MAAGAAWFDDEPFLVEMVSELAQGFLPIAVGELLRGRAVRLREMIEAEADARVQAERLRIARDLHDVVAHGLATIAVQSGVAAHLLDRDPNQAREALEAINATGKSSLEELRAMVGVLRSTDGPSVAPATDGGAPVAGAGGGVAAGERLPSGTLPDAAAAVLRPVPADPADLDDLVDGARAAGVDVTVHNVGGYPADVADGVVVAVHRIVREALTNVARHAGPVPATVSLRHGSVGVEVEIINDPPVGDRTPVPSTGVGVIGMRERAEAVGGRLDVGPLATGGFRVSASIPYRGRHER
jgi:signal transduction histidine kinase